MCIRDRARRRARRRAGPDGEVVTGAATTNAVAVAPVVGAGVERVRPVRGDVQDLFGIDPLDPEALVDGDALVVVPGEAGDGDGPVPVNGGAVGGRDVPASDRRRRDVFVRDRAVPDFPSGNRDVQPEIGGNEGAGIENQRQWVVVGACAADALFVVAA